MTDRTDPTIRSLDDAATYLESLINLEKRPELGMQRMGLDAIRALLARLGDPHAGLSIVHIAGSKGKGSTALFAEAILLELGERVGVFTSPHLERWTERFRIGGQEVEEADLAAAVETLRPHVDTLRRGDPRTAPTFFDATTAAALLLFRRAGVERVILEVGLGGRLDSTNVVTPEVTCITSIELEHTDRLGLSLAGIAGEKAGIMKDEVPCVVGAMPVKAPEEVILRRAGDLATPLRRMGHDFEAIESCELEVHGSHQGHNAALALELVRHLDCAQIPDYDARARKGLGRARLPGRIEVVGHQPLRIVDSAHTLASARALAAALEALPEKRAGRAQLLLSISADKNVQGILETLLPLFDGVTITSAEMHRSLSIEALEREVRASGIEIEIEAEDDPVAAIRLARERVGPDDFLCVAGSVYLAGIARSRLDD